MPNRRFWQGGHSFPLPALSAPSPQGVDLRLEHGIILILVCFSENSR